MLEQAGRALVEPVGARGIALAIEQDALRFEPVDISDLYAVEIDFAEDLERANLYV